MLGFILLTKQILLLLHLPLHLLNPLDLLLKRILSDSLPLHTLELHLLVYLSLPDLYVSACREQQAFARVEASRRVEPCCLVRVVLYHLDAL